MLISSLCGFVKLSSPHLFHNTLWRDTDPCIHSCGNPDDPSHQSAVGGDYQRKKDKKEVAEHQMKNGVWDQQSIMLINCRVNLFLYFQICHFRKSKAEHLTFMESTVAFFIEVNNHCIDCSPLQAIDPGSKVEGKMKEVVERWWTVSAVAGSFGFVVCHWEEGITFTNTYHFRFDEERKLTSG